MSSTTLPHNVSRLDFYRTPAWTVRAIVPVLRRALVYAPTRIVDAGCGDGAIAVELARAFTATVLGVELDAALAAACDSRIGVLETDFLGVEASRLEADLVVSNPPYSAGQPLAWVHRALEIAARRRGVVAFLLPLGWMASKARAPFHRANPADVHVLSRRPSFTGRRTDSNDYAWFVWGPGCGGRWTVLECAPETEGT